MIMVNLKKPLGRERQTHARIRYIPGLRWSSLFCKHWLSSPALFRSAHQVNCPSALLNMYSVPFTLIIPCFSCTLYLFFWRATFEDQEGMAILRERLQHARGMEWGWLSLGSTEHSPPRNPASRG